MWKDLVIVVLSLAASIYAAIQFTSQIAKKSKGEVELGIVGKGVFTLIFFAVMMILGFMSNLPVLSCLVCLVIAIGLVMVNTYFHSNGLSLTWPLIAISVGNFLCSIKEANFTNKNSNWLSTVYIVLIIICMILILVGTAVANVRAFYCEHKEEDDTADSEEEDVEASTSEEEMNDEDDEDDESRRDALILRWIKIAGLVLLVTLLVLLGVWLEVKFDFFPPYIK